MEFSSRPVFRIIFESREHYRVMDTQRRIFAAELAGRVRQPGELWPAVGDYVIGRPQPGDWFLIEQVVERRTLLERRDPVGGPSQVLAANVDTLIIVTSANQDLNLNRLDRYVLLATSGGIRPVIVVNKIELAENPHQLLDTVAARFSTIDVIGMSALEGWNLDALDAYTTNGQTIAFVGSSGVGKSSLTNALLHGTPMTVQAIRSDDDRGRHTTTHRALHVTASGAVVIDTPGIRTVGLTLDSDLESAFADIDGLATHCRFTDCQHDAEPDCAIRNALASGALDAARWASFQKLERELAFERRKASKHLQSEEKKRWAKLHTTHRQRIKLKGR